MTASDAQDLLDMLTRDQPCMRAAATPFSPSSSLFSDPDNPVSTLSAAACASDAAIRARATCVSCNRSYSEFELIEAKRTWLAGWTKMCPDCFHHHSTDHTCAEAKEQCTRTPCRHGHFLRIPPAEKPAPSTVIGGTPENTKFTATPKGGKKLAKDAHKGDAATAAALADQEDIKKMQQKDKELKEAIGKATNQLKKKAEATVMEFCKFLAKSTSRTVKSTAAVNVDLLQPEVEKVVDVLTRPWRATDAPGEVGPAALAAHATRAIVSAVNNAPELVTNLAVCGSRIVDVLEAPTEVATVTIMEPGVQVSHVVCLDAIEEVQRCGTVEELDRVSETLELDAGAQRLYLQRRMELSLGSANPYVPVFTEVKFSLAVEEKVPLATIFTSKKHFARNVSARMIQHMGKKPIVTATQYKKVDLMYLTNMLGSCVSTNHDLGTAMGRIEAAAAQLKHVLPHADSTLFEEVERNTKMAAVIFAAASCTSDEAQTIAALTNMAAGVNSTAFHVLLTDLNTVSPTVRSGLAALRRP